MLELLMCSGCCFSVHILCSFFLFANPPFSGPKLTGNINLNINDYDYEIFIMKHFP